ncbi:2,3-bisphosphoglycerate-independent phosphoglycerate mutase [Patescibacteria group bacterium]|nr:2,3-bisphosphoglycerate-independent phosphoglycerate mutase [Patescibacteria group bacterium]
MSKAQVKKKVEKHEVCPSLLIILDGFGLANTKNKGNAITPETAPNIFGYMKDYPSTELKAHGKDVGLFPGQSGNSEAGHFNIGAGRIVKQDLVYISDAIKDGTFFKNTAFSQALFHAKKYKSAVHVLGLLTGNNSPHARPEHLYALLDFLRVHHKHGVFLHLFTDGRDAPPHAAIRFLKDLQKYMKNGEKIATIMGRMYGMDRNKNWTRTEEAYNTIVGGKSSYTASSPEEAIAQAYNRGETDEQISPTVILDDHQPISTVKNNDVVVFFNARSDRARQLTKAFVQSDFIKKNRGAVKRSNMPKNIRFVVMTDFGPDLPNILTAFPSPDISNCLAKAIDNNRKQLYISETEKYAHVTFFLNGGYPQPINGEARFLIKSKNSYSFADNQEMEAEQITNAVIAGIKDELYNFVCLNFPNADMLAHTGDLDSTKKAIKYMDSQVKRLVDFIQKCGGFVMITADHGSAEEMINLKTNELMTEHSINPVPLIIVGKNLPMKKLKKGRLADVVPTILKLMDIKKPKEMTGKSLF